LSLLYVTGAAHVKKIGNFAGFLLFSAAARSAVQKKKICIKNYKRFVFPHFAENICKISPYARRG